MGKTYEKVNCGLCGLESEAASVIYERIVRCPRCRLVYVTPRPVRDDLFARQSKEYWLNEYLPAYRAENMARRYAHPLQFIRPYRRSGRLLDVGCGLGFFLNEAKKEGWQVEGADVSPYPREFAAQEFGIEVHTGELHELELPRESYDVVALWDVIEHVQQPLAVLREINRLLRPGGLVLVSTPNWNSLCRYLLGEHYQAIGPDDHIYYFTAGTLRRALRETGFQPVYSGSEYLIVDFVVRRSKSRLVRRLLSRPRLRDAAKGLAPRLGFGDQILMYARKRSEDG